MLSARKVTKFVEYILSPQFLGVYIIAGLLAWVASYYALVSRSYVSPGVKSGGLTYFAGSVIYYGPMPVYSVGGDNARTIFTPIYSVDRRIRSEYWSRNAALAAQQEHKR